MGMSRRILTQPLNPEDSSAHSPKPKNRSMKTTLRSTRANGNNTKTQGSSPNSNAEGSSRAATLAWRAIASRDQVSRSDHSLIRETANSVHKLSDICTGDGASSVVWDCHTRRLVYPETSSPVVSDSRKILSRGNLAYTESKIGPTADSYIPFDQARSSSQVSIPGIEACECLLIGERSPITLSVEEKLSDKTSRSSQNSTARTVQGKVTHRSSDPSIIRGRSPAVRTQTMSQTLPWRREVSIPEGQNRFAKRQNSSQLVSDGRGDTIKPSSPRGTDCFEEIHWLEQQAMILSNLPADVDDKIAQQILNNVVIRGDEVYWQDIAGLDIAKNALREIVVYPFLRPDLFMGLREPAQGLLLFGPPGTGKTMLARAVATESRSTFFSLSASSLTSKYLGDSEKLVRALFSLAKALSPSIIFIDEIDSLLSRRAGFGGEHETTGRIKTEFLIQWSNLQRAAAGRKNYSTKKVEDCGDANRVLVLAATNLPWNIDEAARRRFVRRQYIPLPDLKTREAQLHSLLAQQRHELSSLDIAQLVEFTEGFSGSDLTALAKDAAMGPLRSLGDAFLRMKVEEIRPIMFTDFEVSLSTIRPSVNKAGLQQYESWAREYGERGG